MSRRADIGRSRALRPINEGCLECGADLQGDTCPACLPSRQIIPADRASASIYRRSTLYDLLQAMRTSGAMESVDEEIAAMAAEALRLLDAGDTQDPLLRSRLSEVDRVNQLRLLLQGVVSAKKTRQEIIDKGRFYLTIDTFRLFIGEVQRILRTHVDDPAVLQQIGQELLAVSVQFNRSVRSAA